MKFSQRFQINVLDSNDTTSSISTNEEGFTRQRKPSATIYCIHLKKRVYISKVAYTQTGLYVPDLGIS